MRFTAKLLLAASGTSPMWLQNVIEPLQDASQGSMWVLGREALVIKENPEHVNFYYSGQDRDWEGLLELDDLNTTKWENRLDPTLDELQGLPGKMSSQEIKNGGLDRVIGPLVAERYVAPVISRILMIWAGGFYKELGHGASRTVYKIDEEHVIKVAMNDFGISQNKFESYLISKMHNLPLAQIQRTGSKMTYLLVDLAHPFDPTHFEQEYGVTFHEFFNEAHRAEWGRDLSGMDDWSDKALELYQEIHDQGILSDLDRTEQWGDIKDQSVITDYGLGDEGSI